MRLWLRVHSSLWRRLDPIALAHTACASCGQVVAASAPSALHATMEIVERHVIGEAFIGDGRRLVKYCEGSEE